MNFKQYGSADAIPHFLWDAIPSMANGTADVIGIHVMARLMYLTMSRKSQRVYCTYHSLMGHMRFTKRQLQEATKRLKRHCLLTTGQDSRGWYLEPAMTSLEQLAKQRKRGNKRSAEPENEDVENRSSQADGVSQNVTGGTPAVTPPVRRKLPQIADTPFKASEKDLKKDPFRCSEEPFDVEKLDDPELATDLLQGFTKNYSPNLSPLWREFFRRAQSHEPSEGYLIAGKPKSILISGANPLLLKEAVIRVAETSTYLTIDRVANALLNDRSLLEGRCEAKHNSYQAWKRNWACGQLRWSSAG